MAENTAISWCDHTVNFWWGCSKVSPACENCYAETLDARFHPALVGVKNNTQVALAAHWGSVSPRLLRTDAARLEALRYERRAVKEGCRFRVFTNSMSDFFEERCDLEVARLEALDAIRVTPHLDWLILTKRPQRALKLLALAQKMALQGAPLDRNPALAEWLGWWLSGKAPANVWLGTTVEDQTRAEYRIPALLLIPAAVRFLSCEPLLGPVDLEQVVLLPARHPELGQPPVSFGALRGWHGGHGEDRTRLDWVICGGESGPHARPMHPAWARALRDQSAAAGIPFHFKQWGEWAPDCLCGKPKACATTPRPTPGNRGCMFRCGKKGSGRLLDGVAHIAFPEVAHV